MPRSHLSTLSFNLRQALPSPDTHLMDADHHQQQAQRSRRKGQKRKLDDEVAATAATPSSLGSAGTDDDNEEDDGSAGPEICYRHSQAALSLEVRTQVDALNRCFSWRHADRAAAKRATHILAELSKNEDIVPPKGAPCRGGVAAGAEAATV